MRWRQHQARWTRPSRRGMSWRMVLAWLGWCGWLGGVFCLFLSTSWAFELPETGDFRFRLDAETQFHFNHVGDFVLDDLGNRAGTPGSRPFFSRIRLSPSLEWDRQVRVLLQVDGVLMDDLYGFDVVRNQVYFSPILSQAQGELRMFELRQLWVSWLSPIGLLKVGQMASHWGLGMVANDGSRETGEFAISRFGDLVLRASLAIPILSILGRDVFLRRFLLVGAADLVLRDENAELFEGDNALQGVFSFFYRERDVTFVGLYLAIRNQQTRDGTRIQAQVFDGFVRFSLPLGDTGWRFSFAGEFALIRGFTDRLRNEEAPQGVQLDAMGGVARIGVESSRLGLRVGVETGFATGDNDPNNPVSQTFRFDPAYQPSLLLFQRVLGAISAQSGDRLADEGQVGAPAPGSDQVPSYGRLGGALYVQPVVAWMPFDNKGMGTLQIKVGLLYALASADFSDPFNSFRQGGTNTTPMNLAAAERRDLGLELNASLSYAYTLASLIEARLSVLYGHLFPGRALETLSGPNNAVDTFQVRVSLSL